MTATIECPACCREPALMPMCLWCRGAGVLVDMGASPGHGRQPAPEPLERRVVVLLAPRTGGLVALANDGTVWLTGENDAEPWERFADLPQPPRRVDGLELELGDTQMSMDVARCPEDWRRITAQVRECGPVRR